MMAGFQRVLLLDYTKNEVLADVAAAKQYVQKTVLEPAQAGREKVKAREHILGGVGWGGCLGGPRLTRGTPRHRTRNSRSSPSTHCTCAPTSMPCASACGRVAGSCGGAAGDRACLTH